MIDLHTHTTASDGTCAPGRLVDAAVELGLEALAITDHDNFSGYEEAAPIARAAGLELVCGIELSTRLPLASARRGRSVHVLGYFLGDLPSEEFRSWLKQIHAARRDRNRRLAEKLNSLGIRITLGEVESLGGYLSGRPHFAQILVKKGYVSTYQRAFDEYLDESAKGYVRRLEPDLPEGIQRIRKGNGIAVLAHPVRLDIRDSAAEERLIRWMCNQGLQGIEVYHPDHTPEDELRYLEIAERHDLAVTGGSDFHGDIKPDIRLGVGAGNLAVPKELLGHLRELVRV